MNTEKYYNCGISFQYNECYNLYKSFDSLFWKLNLGVFELDAEFFELDLDLCLNSKAWCSILNIMIVIFKACR